MTQQPVRLLLTFLFFLQLSLALALEIDFLDVGQGTSVLITAPTGQTVLYDAGPASSQVAEQLRELGVTGLNLVISSHAHADHIGGMAEVIQLFQPVFYMDNGVPHTTRTYERTLQAALASDAQLLEPVRRTLNLGDVRLVIIPPAQVRARDQNNSSVGLRIDYGSFSALLPGDAEAEQWDYWLREHSDLLGPVDVHMASHHGSRNGDTVRGMSVLEPETVVISLAADNQYGHPHMEALLNYSGSTVYRTDLHGRISIKASPDGSYTVRTGRRP